MAQKITYPDKEQGQVNTNPVEQTYTFGNANEVKNVINALTKIERSTANTTIDNDSYQWNGNTDTGGFIYTLPVGVQDEQHRIVNTGKSGNKLTITPNGLENLLGENTSFLLNDGEALIIGYNVTDGWY